MLDEHQTQQQFNTYARLNREANAANLELFSAENSVRGRDGEASEEDLAAAQAAAAASELRLLQFLQEGRK